MLLRRLRPSAGRGFDPWVWLAVAAALTLALLPAVGRALAAPAEPAELTEICTANGMRTVALEAPAAHEFEAAAACPVCAAGLSAWLTPP